MTRDSSKSAHSNKGRAALPCLVVLFLAGNCAGVARDRHRFYLSGRKAIDAAGGFGAILPNIPSPEANQTAELSGGFFAPPLHEAGPVFPPALRSSASPKFRSAQIVG